MEGYSFFALAFRQKYITRWALMRNTEREPLSSHSMEAAVLAHALATVNREIYGGDADPDKAAVYALFHDCTEVISGDMPSPVKYYSDEMRKTYAKIEESSVNKLLSTMPEELRRVYKPLLAEKPDEQTLKYVKAADKLCALIKCIEEIRCGNSEFEYAKKATEEQLSKYSMPELDYFMENFLPAFYSPLDEL